MCCISFGMMFPLAALIIMSSSDVFVMFLRISAPPRTHYGRWEFISTFAQNIIRSMFSGLIVLYLARIPSTHPPMSRIALWTCVLLKTSYIFYITQLFCVYRAIISEFLDWSRQFDIIKSDYSMSWKSSDWRNSSTISKMKFGYPFSKRKFSAIHPGPDSRLAMIQVPSSASVLILISCIKSFPFTI